MGTVVGPKEFPRRSAPLATPGTLRIVKSPLRVKDSYTVMQTQRARPVVSRTPEVIRGIPYSFGVDWWCFGLVLIL